MKTLALLILLSAPSFSVDAQSGMDSLRIRVNVLERQVMILETRGTSTYIDERKNTMSISAPYIAIGLFGVPHTNAEPFAGIGISLSVGHFGIDGQGRIEYYFGQPADPSIGITQPIRAQWQAAFEGSLRFYLY